MTTTGTEDDCSWPPCRDDDDDDGRDCAQETDRLANREDRRDDGLSQDEGEDEGDEGKRKEENEVEITGEEREGKQDEKFLGDEDPEERR